MNVILDGQLKGTFVGFNDNMLFSFTNNTHWLQKRYQYWYHYAYRPHAKIIEDNGAYFFEILDKRIEVKKISNVIESQINGEFTGWKGDNVYELTNGQKWKQKNYKYEYKYAYMPSCIIYQGNAGYIMCVDGTVSPVERI